MTVNESLPEGWYLIDDHAAKAAEKELTRELHLSHALYGMKVSAIARRQDSDEWLFRLDAGRLAQVHLTYALESTAKWPRARIFADVQEWRQAVSAGIKTFP
jgi:hypothetical protein